MNCPWCKRTKSCWTWIHLWGITSSSGPCAQPAFPILRSGTAPERPSDEQCGAVFYPMAHPLANAIYTSSCSHQRCCLVPLILAVQRRCSL